MTQQTVSRLIAARGAANDNGIRGPRVEVYHKTWCPYSRAALALLDGKGVAYDDIDVTEDRVREAEMVARSGRTSVPEIFVDGELVGGFDDLAALDGKGLLDPLLGLGAGAPGKAA